MLSQLAQLSVDPKSSGATKIHSKKCIKTFFAHFFCIFFLTSSFFFAFAFIISLKDYNASIWQTAERCGSLDDFFLLLPPPDSPHKCIIFHVVLCRRSKLFGTFTAFPRATWFGVSEFFFSLKGWWQRVVRGAVSPSPPGQWVWVISILEKAQHLISSP